MESSIASRAIASRESLICREYTLQDNGHLSDISDIVCFGVSDI